ncbi:probable serine/threonine-protein kinase PIX13 [Ipomoea triloba]|uniref:probable serine/threonine-protein kinase PIX13 n=1 Tax=Ipomoea triloba TaxID=35885 RepID=UPI00125DD280|nr:probable serine/threonine-protein kinase PIX13 [Ipomoea triloba]
MGNCFGIGSEIADPSRSSTTHRSSSSPRPSTPATSRNYSNGAATAFSATSSSAGLSRFSTAGSEDTHVNGEILPMSNLKTYTYADLKAATRNFKSDMVLGVGGFGTVFKGWVDEKTFAPSKIGSGVVVAIKKLNEESMQGFEEWQSEVNFLGRLSHPNLVKLIGYCWEDKELLLVYEFMQKGSLENHLFRRSAVVEPLSWDLRLKIAIGAARGLAFLHTSDKQVIYRDFKASNILLDANYNAKISDFGLAKMGPSGGHSHVTTRVMGTYGYAAPEYVATGHLYVKSDVYGFGVVLLEMLTGLRALDTRRPSGEHNLVDWKKPMLSQKKKLKSIIDARMEGQYSTKAAMQAAQLTLRCLEQEPRKRPSMKEVVEILEEIEGMEKPKKSKSSRSGHSQSSSHHRRPSPRHRPTSPGRPSPRGGGAAGPRR